MEIPNVTELEIIIKVENQQLEFLEIDILPRVNSWDSAINNNCQQAGLTLSTA